jgi:hypothetical protein
MRRRPSTFFAGTVVSLALWMGLACSHAQGADDAPVPPGVELVMAPGSKLQAITPAGQIKVAAGKGLQRCYTWEGATRCVEMWPRKTRWLGSMGLYFPGSGYHWSEHKGIARAVVQEGQQHFQTVDQALAWIATQKKWIPVIYRNDGLLVGWTKNPERKQLNVEVWQLLVGGAKPSALPGAEDQRITVSQR